MTSEDNAELLASVTTTKKPFLPLVLAPQNSDQEGEQPLLTENETGEVLGDTGSTSEEPADSSLEPVTTTQAPPEELELAPATAKPNSLLFEPLSPFKTTAFSSTTTTTTTTTTTPTTTTTVTTITTAVSGGSSLPQNSGAETLAQENPQIPFEISKLPPTTTTTTRPVTAAGLNPAYEYEYYYEYLGNISTILPRYVLQIISSPDPKMLQDVAVGVRTEGPTQSSIYLTTYPNKE